MSKWQNRIAGYGTEQPDQLLANPQNHRIHPKHQQKVMAGALDEIGWIQDVIVNRTTGHIVDGHLRVELALREEEPEIPVKYVELTEEEERKALATLDPIGALAQQDQEMLNELIADIEGCDNEAFSGFLAELWQAPPNEEDEAESARQTLAERFLIPPFSVLDAKQGYWVERKRAWIQLGIKSELGRADNLTFAASCQAPGTYEFKNKVEQQEGRKIPWDEFAERFPEEMKFTGTSIFDPVLCEVAYTWFAPKGGKILDPFAGGSVRGVVAGISGYHYTGIELRPEQVIANRANWKDINKRLMGSPDRTIPPLQVEEIDGIQVVRDDRVQGGTKRRVLQHLLAAHPAQEFVYATPAFGFAQLALSLAAADTGKKATIFTAHRKHLHRRTIAAEQAGATIVTVENGYLTNVQAKAKAYAEETGAHYIEFGVEHEDFIEGLANLARSLEIQPAEVWTVAGSGVLSRALQRAWPDADFNAVQIGADPDVGRATLHKAPEKFEDKARQPPPFPSCPEYDAKAWQFIKRHAKPGALFWNVGGEAELDAEAPNTPTWINADSREMNKHLDENEQFDLVFTCPPYADLEVYSDNPNDISTMDYPDFLEAYRDIIAKACAKLKPNAFAVCVVGEVRSKRGAYYGFVQDTIKAFQDAGLDYYNELVLLTSTGANAMRAAGSFNASRKMVKAHQNVLVFQNGNECQKKAVTHAIKGLSGAIADHFNEHRQVFEAMQNVLVFCNGSAKAATDAMGEMQVADLDTLILESIEAGNYGEIDD